MPARAKYLADRVFETLTDILADSVSFDHSRDTVVALMHLCVDELINIREAELDAENKLLERRPSFEPVEFTHTAKNGTEVTWNGRGQTPLLIIKDTLHSKDY